MSRDNDLLQTLGVLSFANLVKFLQITLLNTVLGKVGVQSQNARIVKGARSDWSRARLEGNTRETDVNIWQTCGH